MARLPGLHVRSFEPRRYLVNHHPLVVGSVAVLDPSARSPLPPPHRLLAGTVIVRSARQPALFLTATDPLGQRCLPAEVTSLAVADAAWAGSVLTTSLAPGLGVAVPLDAQATTTAAVVDQLNQNPLFAGDFLADDAGGRVRIRTREAGAHTLLRVESSLPAAFGPNGLAGAGRDADYRVTDATGEVRDMDGNPLEAAVPTVVVGHFRESELLELTPEARAVLSRRGSLFA